VRYRTRLSFRAQADAAEIYAWYASRDVEAAQTWFLGLRESLRSLESSPERFQVAEQLEDSGLEVREYLYGSGRKKSHRVFFRILSDTVEVLAIRHRAQQTQTAADIGIEPEPE
jgi:plasmid stabilization system protein ParE